MKKSDLFILSFISFLFALFYQCKNIDHPDTMFIGTWISNNNDTLLFDNDFELYLSGSPNHVHRYHYSYTEDSITIQYSGSLFKAAIPHTYYYSIYGDKLTIGFPNGNNEFSKSK